MKITQFIFTSFILCWACSSPEIDHSAYIHSIEQWQEERNHELQDTSSWLSLAGLHWLENGTSTFGADSSNTVIFPSSAPNFAGTFVLEDTSLTLKVSEDVVVWHGEEQVQEMEMSHDMSGATTFLQMGNLNFYAIKRPEGFAIRVKDSQSAELLAFTDIPNFPISIDWKIEASIDWYDEPQPIQIPTVLKSERTQRCPGQLIFEIEGKEYRLHPYLSFYGDPVWTLIFGDLTNGDDSYGGGRFLEIPAPQDGAQSITLDFNKSYNPPCSFSPYATCPLPPPENRLALAIPAGEMDFGNGH